MAVPAQAQVLESASVAGEAAKTQQAAEPLVIPYLSQGQTAADVAPPVYPDAFERAVVSLAPDVAPAVYPDAFERAVVSQQPSPPVVVNYLSHGMTAADALDPRSGIPLSAGIPVAGDPFIADVAETTYTVEPGLDLVPRDRPGAGPAGRSRGSVRRRRRNAGRAGEHG